MKKVLIFFFFLLSCAKKEDTPFNLNKKPDVESFFTHTETHKEKEILSETLSRLNDGLAISTRIAERCFDTELNRINVLRACALTWAIGDEYSNKIEKIIISKYENDIYFLVSAILKRISIKEIQAPLLISIVNSAEDIPSWMKSKIIHAWISKENAQKLSIQNYDLLFGKIPLNEQSSPTDIQAAGELFFDYNKSRWSKLLSNYCDQNLVGSIRLRCWRFLSLFTKRIEDSSEFYALVRPHIPSFQEKDWLIFRINFPIQAAKLELSLKN